MRGRGICYWAAGVLLVLACGLFGAGCFGSGSGNATTTTLPAGGVPTSVATLTTLAGPTSTGENAALSTFKSKDPFIQQAQPVSSTTSTSTGGGSTGTTAKGPTTTFRPPSSSTTGGGSSGSTTSTSGGGSGSTSSTSTTAPHLHTLRVLSIGQVGGSPAVTFQVDGTVYQNKRVGDVVSSNWGQIKVLEITPSSRIVTLLHGSETLVLSQGQVVYQ